MRAVGLVLAVWLLAPACALPNLPSDESAAPPSAISSPPSEIAASLVAETNAERARVGLPGLSFNARLAFAAQLQADQCARLGRIDHVLPEAQFPRPEDRIIASGYAWDQYGENLALGQDTPAAAVQSWMGSPAHRANILHANFTELGVGIAIDGAGRSYYVQVFGKPR